MKNSLAASRYIPLRKVGILGGGQLARMLALKAANLGLEVHILSTNEDDPAAQVVRHWHRGDPNNATDLKKFFAAVELVTFESEFYSGHMLGEVQDAAQVPVLPPPAAMALLQDRKFQKLSLLESQVPTSEFTTIDSPEDLKKTMTYFPQGLVLKKRQGGYDGNGTFIIRNTKQMRATLEKLKIVPDEFIAEAFVPFKRELALMMARSLKGDIVHLPLVQTVQTENRCDVVWGPIHHSGLRKLITKLEKFLERTGYVGVIGFELFDTGKQLLVNEVAPRVHNSGHYSIDALATDQFTLHWLALLGFEMHKPQSLGKAFVMTNLIGLNEQAAEFPKDLQGNLHWYGKKENRKGRKMGHINYTGTSVKGLLKSALAERKKIKNLGPR